jgi:hypothetical protein
MGKKTDHIRTWLLGGVDFELPAVSTAWWLTYLLQDAPLKLGTVNTQAVHDVQFVKPDLTRHDLTTYDAIYASDGRLLARIEAAGRGYGGQ